MRFEILKILKYKWGHPNRYFLLIEMTTYLNKWKNKIKPIQNEPSSKIPTKVLDKNHLLEIFSKPISKKLWERLVTESLGKDNKLIFSSTMIIPVCVHFDV